MLDSNDKSVDDIVKEAASQLDQKNDIIYLMIAGTRLDDDSIKGATLKINGKINCLIPMLSNIILQMSDISQKSSINDILLAIAQDIDSRVHDRDE